MNIKKEFEYINKHFSNISKEQLFNELKECGLKTMNITPDNITELKSNEVFVFGSNLAGIHGAGAAKLAYEKFGAIKGQGFGLQGQSFAIPTKDMQIKTLPIEKIRMYIQIAEAHFIANPTKIFLVTEIGCGLARYEPEDIAPLFKSSYQLPNVYMPKRFWEVYQTLTKRL